MSDTLGGRQAFIAAWRERRALAMAKMMADAPAAETPDAKLARLTAEYTSTPVRASPRLLSALGYDAPGASGMPADDDIDF